MAKHPPESLCRRFSWPASPIPLRHRHHHLLDVPLEPLRLGKVPVSLLVDDLQEVRALVEEDCNGFGKAGLEAVGPGKVKDRDRLAGG
jgi:hypothetical protein